METELASTNANAAAAPPTSDRARTRRVLSAACRYFVLGAFIGLAVWQLGLPNFNGHVVVLCAAAAAVIGVTRYRSVVWAVAGLFAAFFLLISYTPLSASLVRSLYREDELSPAPAVVVLASVVHDDRELSARAQERTVQGYTVLRLGHAPRLVLTRPPPPIESAEHAVLEQMKCLGLDYPVDIVGPVTNTHDEAVAVAALAAERRWDRVVLVTHPWHMRRAAAAFEKAGVKVICSPCAEGTHDLSSMAATPSSRLAAFRYWLHEAVGYRVYRWRGWV
jgi:uncharacterized SAM-binding protein YcdF (DUF218 family)